MIGEYIRIVGKEERERERTSNGKFIGVLIGSTLKGLGIRN